MKKIAMSLFLGLVNSAYAGPILVDFQVVPSQSTLQATGYVDAYSQHFVGVPQGLGADVAHYSGVIHTSVNRSGAFPLAVQITPSLLSASPSGNWQPLGTPADYGLVFGGFANAAARNLSLDVAQPGRNLYYGGTFAVDALTADLNAEMDLDISSSGNVWFPDILSAAGQGSITLSPLQNGNNLWTLHLPVSVPFTLIDDATANAVGTLAGTITATAEVTPPVGYSLSDSDPRPLVPEPSSVVLCGVGAVLLFLKWKLGRQR